MVSRVAWISERTHLLAGHPCVVYSLASWTWKSLMKGKRGRMDMNPGRPKMIILGTDTDQTQIPVSGGQIVGPSC